MLTNKVESVSLACSLEEDETLTRLSAPARVLHIRVIEHELGADGGCG